MDTLAFVLLALFTLLTAGAFALTAVLPAEPVRNAPPVDDDPRDAARRAEGNTAYMRIGGGGF